MSTTLMLAEAAAAKAMPILAVEKDRGVVKQVLLEAYEAAGLTRLKVNAEINARIDAASKMGLVRVETREEACELLYREMYPKAKDVTCRLDYRYSSMDSRDGDWGHSVDVGAFEMKSKGGPDVLFQHGVVGNLMVPVPRGVALRIAEARQSGIFDEIAAVAPNDAFKTPLRCDPIVIGEMRTREMREWEYRESDTGPILKKSTLQVGYEARARFIIAIWQ